MLELCKLVLEPTRPTGAYLPASPLQPTDRANAGKWNTKRVSTSMRCSNWSSKSGTKASPYQTDPCFKCLELWIRHRFTEILSLKEQQKKKKNYKPINGLQCCMPPFFFFFLFFFILQCTGLIFYYSCNF